MIKLSIILIAKNEEQNIEECLKSVEWADEKIVVVDSSTTDRTADLARNFTDKVYEIDWLGFSGTKNFALEKATAAWILWIDADERVTEALRREIEQVISQKNTFDGYMLPRLANFLGRWIRHCGWYPGYVMRLFKKGAARFNESLVHEGLDFEGDSGKLAHPLLHYTDREIKHYFDKYNTYTSLAADDLLRRNRTFKLRDLVFRPFFAFVKMYILRLGFLDGIQGFILSAFSASYVFTKYAKLWERSR
ncbi:glycosyltransferase family 2 protein [candidate division KSB1 bacterium]|nr:glycosyltransferase family 2 protein [candidate division KSB1 bacterium]